MRQSLRSP
jgi:hypothetical protein